MHLREQIISGKLQKGKFLRIEAIAKELNISSTPVREGLLLLQRESLVELLPRRGFVVNSFSQADLGDLFWAQAVIGAELAARAAPRLSESELDRLQELCTAHARAVAAGDLDAAAHLGLHFHRAINLAAQSQRLALLLGSLTKQLPLRFYASVEGELQGAIEYHPLILNALRMKDVAAVRALMQSHIQSGGDFLIAALQRTKTNGAAAGAEVTETTGARTPAKPRRKRRIRSRR
jgi:DNA-binding GntR family transcriptional regulator